MRRKSKGRIHQLRARLAQLQRDLDQSLFRREQAAKNAALKLGLRYLRILVVTFRGAANLQLRFQAAALTYFTLLSVVPLLAVVFSLFKAFGGLEKVQAQVRDLALDYIAAGNKEQVAGYFDTFIENFHARTLGGVGVAVLFIVAVLLLGNIETAFNRIWGVPRPRNLLQRFTIYWSLITLGPVLLGVSLTLTASFRSSTAVDWMVTTFPFGVHLLKLTPLVATWIAFTLLFLIMPHTKVMLRAALFAGIVSGTIFEILKFGYAVVAAKFFSYNAFYGSLGAIPVLIIWFNWAWRTVLLGGHLSYAAQHVATHDPIEDYGSPTLYSRERLAWRALVAVAAAFMEGGEPPSAGDLSEGAGAPGALMAPILNTLEGGGFIRTIDVDDATGYVPAMDPARIDLAQLVDLFRRREGRDFGAEKEGFDLVDRPRQQVNDEVGRIAAGVLLEEVTRRYLSEKNEEPAPPGNSDEPHADERPEAAAEEDEALPVADGARS